MYYAHMMLIIHLVVTFMTSCPRPQANICTIYSKNVTISKALILDEYPMSHHCSLCWRHRFSRSYTIFQDLHHSFSMPEYNWQYCCNPDNWWRHIPLGFLLVCQLPSVCDTITITLLFRTLCCFEWPKVMSSGPSDSKQHERSEGCCAITRAAGHHQGPF